MTQSPLIKVLWSNQKMAKNTDCSFVFKIKGENGEGATEKTIHANKFILSSVSPYFEANFKDEWQGNKPIPVTTVEYSTFEMMIRAIYLGEIEVKNLEEALKLYEAINFYQLELLINLIQTKIQQICYSNGENGISKLVELAEKFEDYRLKEFYRKYFVNNTKNILQDPDFLNLSPELVNHLYNYHELSVTEEDLLVALENYVKEKNISLSKIKPAIGAIRFFALPEDKIEKTSLLSSEEKDFYLGKSNICTSRLSTNPNGRKVKSFFEKLSSKTQAQMLAKLSYRSCWNCREYHNMLGCSSIKEKYSFVYAKLISYSKVLQKYSTTNFETYSEEDIITILKIFQKGAGMYSYFSHFQDIDKEIDAIKYVS